MELGQLGNMHELLIPVLDVDGLLLALLPADEDSGQLADDGDDLTGLVGGVVLQVGRPGRGQAEAGLQHPEAEKETGGRNQTWRCPGQVVLQQGDLDQILNTTELVTSRTVQRSDRLTLARVCC